MQGVAGQVGDGGEEEKKKVRGQAIRELANFFAKEDKDNYFSGLMRVAAKDGSCCWCTQESADEMQRLGEEEEQIEGMDDWQEVHLEGGASYWWNTCNNETTARGESEPDSRTLPLPPPPPPSLSLLSQQQPQQLQQQQQQQHEAQTATAFMSTLTTAFDLHQHLHTTNSSSGSSS